MHVNVSSRLLNLWGVVHEKFVHPRVQQKKKIEIIKNKGKNFFNAKATHLEALNSQKTITEKKRKKNIRWFSTRAIEIHKQKKDRAMASRD